MSSFADTAEYEAVLAIAKAEAKHLLETTGHDIHLTDDVLKSQVFDCTLTEIDARHSDLHHLEAHVVYDIAADAVDKLFESMRVDPHADYDR